MSEHDYDLSKKVKITFKGMGYYVMPRYKEHYLNHEYERFSLQLLKNNLSSDSLFVDIGAHYGAYSLYAANAAGSNVYAIEPVLENFTLLNENIAENKLESKITSFDYAASDGNGEAEFNIPWASDSAGFYNHPNAETIRKQKVTTRKIDDVVGDAVVDVIKIDTEGHELGVLRGLKKTLKRSPNAQLIIEINPPLLERAGTDAMALLEMVKGFGKEIYMVNEDTFTMHRITDRLEEWPKYINAGNYANLYCVPAAGHQYMLFVCHTAELGGAELAMLEQINELRKKNAFAHVVVPGEGPLVDRLIEHGIGFTVVRDYHFWLGAQTGSGGGNKSRENIRAAQQITKLAGDIAPTVIVNNSMVTPWGYPAALTQAVPLVWMIHEYGDLDHGLHFAYGAEHVRKFIVDTADVVVSCSNAVKKVLVESDPRQADKVKTVYNLLYPNRVVERAQEPASSRFFEGESLKVCVVGKVSEGKGQLLVVEAIKRLRDRGVAAELLVIGSADAPYKSKIKKAIKEYGLSDQIQLVGFTDNPYPYIAAADVVVVASRNEAFGRVAAEAMILNTLVIASNAGGSRELITDGKTGMLFKPGDVDDLVKSLMAMNKLTKAQREKIQSDAQQSIEKLLNVRKNADELYGAIANAKVSADKVVDQKTMLDSWLEGVNSYERVLCTAEEEIAALKEQVRTQEANGAQLLEAIDQLRNSQSYRVGRKLSSVKHRLIRKKFDG